MVLQAGDILLEKETSPSPFIKSVRKENIEKFLTFHLRYKGTISKICLHFCGNTNQVNNQVNGWYKQSRSEFVPYSITATSRFIFPSSNQLILKLLEPCPGLVRYHLNASPIKISTSRDALFAPQTLLLPFLVAT